MAAVRGATVVARVARRSCDGRAGRTGGAGGRRTRDVHPGREAIDERVDQRFDRVRVAERGAPPARLLLGEGGGELAAAACGLLLVDGLPLPDGAAQDCGQAGGLLAGGLELRGLAFVPRTRIECSVHRAGEPADPASDGRGVPGGGAAALA